MTRKKIKTVVCALFHDGIDVDSLSAKAKAELRAAIEILLATSALRQGQS